jgi:uncharacterized damage-inducible protein DinB
MVAARLAYAKEYAKHLRSQAACDEFPHRPPEHDPGGRRYSGRQVWLHAGRGARSVEQALAHIAVSTRMWQEAHASGTTKMHEYDWATAFVELEAEEKKKRSKKELVDLLKNEGERFTRFLEGLSEDKLAEQITEDPSQPTKSRLEALMSAKEHEMHCRGQLMLIERMLGIVPHLTRKYAEMEREMREAAGKKTGQTARA